MAKYLVGIVVITTFFVSVTLYAEQECTLGSGGRVLAISQYREDSVCAALEVFVDSHVMIELNPFGAIFLAAIIGRVAIRGFADALLLRHGFLEVSWLRDR
ncbi:hypothetical protein [Actinomadura coerulea]|uniref:hypothetical protein n=1 Tax=Actinomadura coerulea TaxID=46159 RepID=UPI00342C12C9